MINLIELVNKYVEDGYNEIYANAKVAQDIILRYLFKSEYKNHITLKGGVVMYNLTQDKRRATISAPVKYCINPFLALSFDKKVSDVSFLV